MAEYYIGMMSGTSMDAMDAVLVEFRDEHPDLIATLSRPLPPHLGEQLLTLTSPGINEIERCAQADLQLGRFCAESVKQLLAKSSIDASHVTAIGSHGQTIRHAPDAHPSYTVQIGDGNTIAQLTGITTVADFRRRDMVVGGEGAPLVPAFHSALYRSEHIDRVILNLGGIANISILPRDNAKPVTGFDTGPANVLLDIWCQRHRNEAYDREGLWAASGTTDEALLQRLLSDPYFQRTPPKSTGREYFNLEWLQDKLQTEIAPEDIQATLTELSARSIATAITSYSPEAEEVIVCGGGAYNQQLMHRISANLPGLRVISSEKTGLQPRWIEATAFAWLARRTLQRLPGNLPAVTGASEPVVLGAIYPSLR